MAVTKGTQVTQAQMDALAALANTKLAAMGSPSPFAFTSGAWLTEINRLRTAINVAVTAAEVTTYDSGNESFVSLNDPQFCVSGPWAFSGDGQTSGNHYVEKDTSFNGYGIVNFKEATFYFADTSGVTMQSIEQITTATPGTYPIINYDDNGTGINTSSTIKLIIGGDTDGVIKFKHLYWTCINSTGSTPPTLTYSTDLPGITWNQVNMGNDAILYAELTGEAQSISPGEYEFLVSCPATHSLANGNATAVNATGVSASTPMLFVVEWPDAPVDAPEALHGTKTIKKIVVPEIAAGSYGPGIWSYTVDPSVGYPPRQLIRLSSFALSTNDPPVNGIFVATTEPINIATVQNTALGLDFPQGDNVMRLPAPNPATPVINTVDPAISFRPPRYPCFRDTATIPTGGDWDTWNPAGWMIYSLTARRKATPNAAGILQASAAASDITVKIGHMKNGVFTEGVELTIPAGSKESATEYVCWPIFTGTPLAYQCTEELFIAATACRAECSWRFDTASNTPILAAHYNDLETILNLL